MSDDDTLGTEEAPPTKEELIALAAAVRAEYLAKQDESDAYWDVYYRMAESLKALSREESLANNPDIAPWHFKAAIASARAVGDDLAAKVFGQIRDFLGVEELE